MQIDLRREPRRRSRGTYGITWKGEDGVTHSAQVTGSDESASGTGFRCSFELRPGTVIYIQDEGNTVSGYGVVRHLTGQKGNYLVGLELDEEAKSSKVAEARDAVDYYEFLQINPKAQTETIQRVYRFLAARYHPDNPETGDPEKFLQLNEAYQTLSDPERRADYDEKLKAKAAKPSELFESVDFLDGIDGEINRRLAVLSLIYKSCRSNIHSPQLSLLDLEAQMGFPRDYLDFTIWYLRGKKLIIQADNATFSLTCEGIDFVEENLSKIPMFGKLLSEGRSPMPRGEAREQRPDQAKTAGTLFLAGAVSSGPQS